MRKMFPITLNLNGRKCLVIGGGRVAERKISTLLECGAAIKVVCPEPGEKLKQQANEGKIFLIEREFIDSDLEDCVLVFVATNDHALNQRICEKCLALNIMINAVDDPDNSSFFVPSTLRRGALSISVSTEGRSPLLAKKIRQDLESLFGPEYAEYMDILGEARAIVKDTIADEAVRREVFKNILELDLLSVLKTGNRREAKERIQKCISSWQE